MTVKTGEPLPPVQIGIDIGKVHDPSATCATEVTQAATGRFRQRGKMTPGRCDPRGFWIPPQGIQEICYTHYTIRHITRLPLGMSYPDIAQHIADMLERPRFAGRQVGVFLDVTGVGRPVFDMVKAIILERKDGVWLDDGSLQLASKAIWHVRLRPITFVGGESYNRTKGTVGKSFIVSKLQTHLQHGRLHAPDTPEVKAMIGELRTYAITLNEHGHEQYGASSGKHDDLATAAALSTLEDPYTERESLSNRVY